MRLFIERGFAATTITLVAAAASVSPETIYATCDGKRGLLEGVVDTAIAGGVEAPLELQPVWGAIRQHRSARERLRAYVALTCRVLARTSAIHHVIRGAADSEVFAADLSARLLRERLASNTTHLRDYIGDELRVGLTWREAAERYCAISSPEVHHLLTTGLGWSRRAHEAWLWGLAEQDLIGPRSDDA
ncbi:MAG: helix-turn-helix transcriptional regulator [Gemmatimonadaceae bacterium]|nr:helix-turn-helix transcriptional regulator [Gemmatimonadaceae bacterium]